MSDIPSEDDGAETLDDYDPAYMTDEDGNPVDPYHEWFDTWEERWGLK